MGRAAGAWVLVIAVLAGCTQNITGHPSVEGRWSFDASGMDLTVRPGDSLFDHAVGSWAESADFAADEVCVGVNSDIEVNTITAVDLIVAEAVADDAPPGDPSRMIADLYESYVDEDELERRGLDPVRKYLSAVDGITDRPSLSSALVRLYDARSLILGPFPLFLDIDPNRPTRYLPNTWQGGLSLEDRDYYVSDDPDFAEIRTAYVEHVAAMLELAGYPDSRGQADRVLALETALAEIQWPLEATMDSLRTNTVLPRGDVEQLAAGAPLKEIFDGYGVPADTDVLVGMPDVLTGTAALVATAPLGDWQAYLRYQVLSAYGDFLTEPFQREVYNFYDHVLYGAEGRMPRDSAAVNLVNDWLGDIVGERYVQRHFDNESKDQLHVLVENVRSAFADRISAATWMSDETRREALAKLSAMVAKIGHPDEWVSYQDAVITADDLIGNVENLNAAEWVRSWDRLGKPLDRKVWDALAQENNAFYDPQLNDITFTAALLQPPFFDPSADAAANYGAIAATIGHEMSHAFDSDGRKSDSAGALRNWWAPGEIARYEAESDRLVAQYDAFEPFPGEYVDGELTLSENIADLVGLQVAYDAYQRSLNGQEAPVIDGFSGDERFFLAYAGSWKDKCREEYERDMLQTDTHSPARYRVDGVVRNMDEWYATFEVKDGDELFLAPADRVRMW